MLQYRYFLKDEFIADTCKGYLQLRLICDWLAKTVLLIEPVYYQEEINL